MTEAAAAVNIRPTERKRRYRRAGMSTTAYGPTENMFRSAAVAARDFDFQEALVTALLGVEVAAAEEEVQEEMQTSVIRTYRGILWAANAVLRVRPPALKLLPGQARRRTRRGSRARTRENADEHPCMSTAAAVAAAAIAAEAIRSARKKRETTRKVRGVPKT